MLDTLTSPEYGCLSSLDEITAVGHRIVHGGEKFNASVLITDEVIKEVEECSDLAPLHNPANLKGVHTITKVLPKVPQVAVFDTAFHQTMPNYAFMYAIPYDLYEKYGIRRYGFHGTSHRYVAKRVCDILEVDANNKKIITCHVGNGGSITAVKNGKSIDTSMGLTPVEGLMMGTRSGDIDAGVLTFLMDKENLDSQGVSDLVNKKSGLKGVSGVSSDMRELDAAIEKGNENAKLAQEMYFYRVTKYIGAYVAAMGGVDVIVFTGGVGENHIRFRSSVCEKLAYLGVKIDEAVNQKTRGDEAIITSDDSKVKVVVVPTDEEFMIASDTRTILGL